MRVLFASHTSVISGAEHTLLDLVRGLPGEIDAVAACPEGDLRDRLSALGVETHPLVGTSGSLRLHPRHTPVAVAEAMRSAWQLRAAAARCGADVIHANSTRAGLIGAITRSIGGPPLVAYLHNVLPGGRLGSAIAATIAVSCREVLGSTYTAADFVRRSNGRGHAVVVDNPVDLDRFDPTQIDRAEARARLGLPPDVPVAGVVAQITPWKAQSDAIRAIAVARRSHPELRLVVAGEAKFVTAATRHDNQAYARSLRELCRKLGSRTWCCSPARWRTRRR